MHRTTCLGLVLAAVAATGCSTPSTAPAGARHQVVSLASLGPAIDRDVFFFGAGDALGQEIFTYYVASLRLDEREQRYATGTDDFPE